MSRLWARIMPIAGSLCLAGSGIILYRSGTGSGVPGIAGSVLFLLFALLLPFVSALSPSTRNTERFRPARVLLLLACLGMVAMSLGFFRLGGASGGSVPLADDNLRRLALGQEGLERLAPALDSLGARLAHDLFASAVPESGLAPGHLFRDLDQTGDLWKQEYGNNRDWQPAAVVWSGDERIAWTRGAVPLTPAPNWDDHGDGNREIRLVDGRGGWYLRQIRPLTGERFLEIQVPLNGAESLPVTLDLSLQIVPVPHAMATLDEAGRQVSDVVMEGVPSGAVRLTAPDPGTTGALIRWRAEFLLAALALWLLAIVAFGRLSHGSGWILAALWIARALLAEVELLRWVSGLFPGLAFPAAPGSLVSLVDPAYFATPFAFGWFASAADALLTTLLIAGTAWWLLARQGLVAGSGRPDSTGRGPALWVRGLLFGSTAGILLLGLRFLAGMLAENANARLIGTGVSLSFLSFWGLHVALMLASFSLAALVTGFGAGRMWRGRSQLPSWLAAALLAGLVAGLAGMLVGGLGRGGSLLAVGVTAGLWCVGAALHARPRFLRRFVWPTVVLLTVVWNYGSLREVYDRAERSWLQRKGGLITQADQDWTRYLLGSVLEDMRDRENATVTDGPAEDIWRDEPAWAMWRDSALRDLGYSCLVELLDAEEYEESLFARGFLRDFHYEIEDRSSWVGADGQPVGEGADHDAIFQVENRMYAGGEEKILIAEIERLDWKGWIRVELPLRSWRISTQMESLGGIRNLASNGYRPRAEIDRPMVLLLADESGWLAAGEQGFPGAEFTPRLKEMQDGQREWVSMDLADATWFCRWNPLPASAARTPGEGFVLGLKQPGLWANLLDLSRLMLLNLVLYFLLYGAGQVRRQLAGKGGRISWAPGFQERFLSGYLLLGLILLLVVGTSVDRVGYDRVRGEARSRTRAGMTLAVEQLRSLLVEQGTSLAESEYIGDLLRGQLAGNRTVGPVETRQGMVFSSDGTLLLDETLSDLDDHSARALLAAGREAPMVVIREYGNLYVGTVIPLDLGGFLAGPDSMAGGDLGHGGEAPGGFFFYRQILDGDLIGSLADLAHGQATLRIEGKPVLASHPEPVFAGRAPLLADPDMMAVLFDHPSGMGVFASPDRPFAYAGTQPLPAFSRDGGGRLVRRAAPAYLALDFPDREREHVVQRRGTVLFLAGLANLILLTALLLAMLMSWSIFRPLRLLMTATRSLAQGQFDAPLPEAGRDEIGSLAGAFGLMRNELQSARNRLEARERFLTTVLDRVTVGVAVVDTKGRMVTLNPAGREILEAFYPGVGHDEVLTELVDEFGPADDRGPTLAAEMRSPDGRRTLRGARAPLALPGGRIDTMLVFEDITEFLSTKKMAINAELARQVAHEIKNPLTPIQLSVQLLDQARRDEHPDLDRILQDTVTRVLDQVTLLRSIAGEFSLLGRPGELVTEPLDLLALVTEVAAGYGAGPDGSSRGGAAVPVVAIDMDQVPDVRAHRETLLKILGNLMQNSLDAARGEGPVHVAVSWLIEPATVTMIWTDDGTGLPPEVADRLFDPYFSTKSKGTGLGLAICRNLADRMSGSITLANSDEGLGARAELRLPRADHEEID